jgi:uncharacterized membrane-anchored protein YhcB (DUF1043 family)
VEVNEMMDAASWFSLMNVVLVVAGIAIGLAVGFLASPAIGKAKRLRAELDRTLQEHEAYKASVNAHFRKTADLVGQMTRSYAAVYDHLAGGARQFCDEGGAETKVPFGPSPDALAPPTIETGVEDLTTSDHSTDVEIAETTPAEQDVAAEASLHSASETTTSETER